MKVYKIMINMDINRYAVPYFTFQPKFVYWLDIIDFFIDTC